MVSAAKSESYIEAAADSELTRLCVRGDEQAWRSLHERYFRVAAGFLRRLGVGDADLEDATQDVFLQVFRYLPRFREEAELKTWIYQLCITQARRTRRAQRVLTTLRSLFGGSSAESLLSAPSFCEEAALRQIDAALATLPESERTAFVLYEMEGLSAKEIGAVVGAKDATVWSRLHFARKSFRKALGIEQEGQP
jgi:RNA polymerase sigma-70 factor (ECF subfamily)